MSLRRVVVPLLALAILGDPRTAAGQAASEPVEQARVLFDEGIAAIGRADYATALEQFLQSYELNPKPIALFNAGMCYRALEDLVAADATLRRYLTASSGDEADRIVEAARVVRELDGLLGRVDIRVLDGPAEVLIDGRRLEADPGRGPIRVAAGEHVFEARWPEGDRAEARTQVDGGQSVDVVLERPPPPVVVEPDQPPIVVVGPDGSAGIIRGTLPVGISDFDGTAEEEDGGVLSAWWFWTIVGAVVVGTGVTLGVVLGMPENGPEPDWRVIGPP